ncbi:MAG TPA: class I adenylate-forming enzyme family protein [Chthoniobacterales bacterium]|jgi:acyl-CoA synthetase (AMP-forming)/AMP-acid ligase II|nr:class I adenylate-forming enzyme family protein [Chthoniobacterales bacterium]
MGTPGNAIAPLGLTLDRVVTYWSEKCPERLALEHDAADGWEGITWRQFESYIAGATDYLGHSTAPGDIAGVVCDNGFEFHILVNALWRCGTSVLLIDRSWGPAIVEDLLRLTDCPVLYCKNWGVQLGASRAVRRDYPARREGAVRQTDFTGDLDVTAIYATTSGTTDNPKCVAISHRKIRAAYRACLAVHNFSGIREAASLFDLNSLGVLGVCFLLPREIGAATRVFPSFTVANIRATWDAVLHSSIGFVYLVPPLVRLLNTMRSKPQQAPRLLAFCASAPVQRMELRKLEAKFPVTAFNSYGLTELTFAVFFGCRDDEGLATDSIGYPVGIEARIVNDSESVVSGPGRGELHLKGPMLTDGYLHNETATNLAWDGAWFRTGDIAERDAAGRYFICGRKKDTVLRGGVTYYLHELEHYVRRAPAVVDACAFKGRDLPSGDELCVVVQVNHPKNPEDLLKWIRDNLGENKVPNVLIVWEHALPRNSNGKVVRHVLARLYLAGELAGAGRA